MQGRILDTDFTLIKIRRDVSKSYIKYADKRICNRILYSKPKNTRLLCVQIMREAGVSIPYYEYLLDVKQGTLYGGNKERRFVTESQSRQIIKSFRDNLLTDIIVDHSYIAKSVTMFIIEMRSAGKVSYEHIAKATGLSESQVIRYVQNPDMLAKDTMVKFKFNDFIDREFRDQDVLGLSI